MDDCIFCKIAAGSIPVPKVAEDESGVAFPDINPQAPSHFLVIPREHVASLNDVKDFALLGKLYSLAARVAKEKGLDQTGYRTVINTGPDAQQTVFHLHLHLIAGRQMRWPPG